MIQAFINAVSGVAVYAVYDRWHVVKCQFPSGSAEISQRQIPYILGDRSNVQDLRFEGVDDIHSFLNAEYTKNEALDFTLILLDRDMDDEDRMAASGLLEASLADEALRRWLQCIFMTQPLLSSVDMTGAIRIGAGSPAVNKLLMSVARRQELISAVHSALCSTLDTYSANEKRSIFALILKENLFQRIFFLIDQTYGKDRIVELVRVVLQPVRDAPGLAKRWIDQLDIKDTSHPETSVPATRVPKAAGSAEKYGGAGSLDAIGEGKSKSRAQGFAPMTMREMLEAGVHFGHQTRFWHPGMAPYIFGHRNKIHIINLERSLQMYSEAMRFIAKVAAGNGSVLFVCTKRVAQDVVPAEAARAGSPYVAQRWMGGMLTNFRTLKLSVNRLKSMESYLTDNSFEYLSKKERILFRRDLLKLQKYFDGIRDMERVPEAIFVIDVGYHKIAVAEANKLGIPVIGVVDTNHSPAGIDYVIPGNDDSQKAIALYARGVADAILAGRAMAQELVATQLGNFHPLYEAASLGVPFVRISLE